MTREEGTKERKDKSPVTLWRLIRASHDNVTNVIDK
jgi:hypothetical protein